jgi:hypothetical protein
MKHESGFLARALQGWGVDAWPLLQRTAAATVARLIASSIVGNQDPFFAPLSAVVALNAPLGERGRNALRRTPERWGRKALCVDSPLR